MSEPKLALDKVNFFEFKKIHHFVYKMNSMFPWVNNNCPTPYDFAEVLEACGLVMVDHINKPLEDEIITQMEQEFLLRGFVIDASKEEDGMVPCFEVAIDMTADFDEVSIIRK